MDTTRSRFPSRAPALLSCSLLLALAGPLAAQEGRGTVPMEMARVLFGGTRVADILVGEMPRELRATLPLDELGRVVGAFARSERNGMVILALEASEDEAVSAFERLVADHGFARPSNPMEGRGGFVGTAASRFQPWCGESVALTVSPVRADDGGTYLRVSYSEAGEGPCNPQIGRGSRMLQAAALPSLAPPPGATARMEGTGTGRASAEAAASIRSELTVPEIAGHYAHQLEDAGWTPAGGSADSSVDVRRFTLEEDGAPWVGLLAVWRLAPGRHWAVVRKDRADAAGR